MRTTLYVSVLSCGILLSCNGNSTGKPVANTILNEQVDSIVIVKSKRMMEVYNHQRLAKTYHVCLGPEPIGPKHVKNDGKTPEGMYHINGKNPNSHYHKCLGVSYPSAEDVRYAASVGKPTGGDIKIHGLPNGRGYLAKAFARMDWTAGCIALKDDEIDELYAHVAVGTCVNILP